MRLRRKPRKTEPTIALINIVFLMLVFFLVAGTLAQPLDPQLSLIKTRDLEGREPPDALLLHPDGRLTYRGADVADAQTFMAALSAQAHDTIRIVPDRDAPAADLVATAHALRAAGAKTVLIVTERAVP